MEFWIEGGAWEVLRWWTGIFNPIFSNGLLEIEMWKIDPILVCEEFNNVLEEINIYRSSIYRFKNFHSSIHPN